jgi:hypothetical protein
MLAGHNLTLSAGPGAGLLGVGTAVAALRAGRAAALLSGAVDELSDRILADQYLAGLVSAGGAAPPGEGAAIWMLETAAHAQARGAKPLAEVCSIACSTEIVRADGADDSLESIHGIMLEAFQQAGITAGQVAAVCADVPQPRLAAITGRVCPTWKDRRVSVARLTGRLEGAQILADLDTAWRIPSAPASTGYVLALVSSPHGVNCAAVFKKG